MVEMREQFEKLPEIKGTIFEYKHEVIFDESENKYTTPCYSTFEPEYVYFLNGAWYAFQEQQKKIDGALKILDGMRHNGAYRAIDILKGTDK